MSRFIYCYAECRHAECHFTECRGARKTAQNRKKIENKILSDRCFERRQVLGLNIGIGFCFNVLSDMIPNDNRYLEDDTKTIRYLKIVVQNEIVKLF